MNPIRWAAAAFAVAAVTTACSTHPLIPSSVAHHPASPAALAADPPGPPPVGIDLYVARSYPPATVEADGRRALAYIKSLHATAAALVWNLHSPGLHSDRVERPRSLSLTPAEIGALTRIAKADGLAVQYRPIIRVGRAQLWEGRLRPADPAAWFASLYHVQLPYLRIAQRLHVAQFVVGTELYGLNTSPQWRPFEARVAKVYSGTVTAADLAQNYIAGQLTPVPGEIGLDPYMNLPLANSATQAQVTAAWEHWFAPVPAATRERTELDETGFIAVHGGYQYPEKWQMRGVVDYAMQKRWFTAACQTVAHYHMAGIWFYEINLGSENPDAPNPFPAFFAQRPGARAIRRCAQTLNGAS